ncbi:MAG: uroporphyrinogen decarboxylase [Phycisphaerae bacterium]|nr:uroporphyrinogen decarboxylase [Phycisphaerae bacterium]
MRTRFIDACHRKPVDARPIWLMRQAGRYMSEYRKLRETYGILDLIKTPEMAVEVTMQPINAFDLDAAIIFADILPLLEGMGLNLEFIKGTGPLIDNPIRQAADIDKLHEPDPRESVAYTLKAITLARQVLKVPLIGFSGAPFTLACYAIEGGASRNFTRAKSLMYEQPKAWHQLMEKLSTLVGEYLFAQAEAGAQVLQLFDSWVGALSPDDYREYAMPYSAKAIRRAKESGCPVIHFGTNTSGMLPLIKEGGGDVIGVDWRIDISDARQILGPDVVIQGNLDPVQLYAPVSVLKDRVKTILDKMGDDPGYIFNLGHGLLPTTPVDHVAELIHFVHEYSSKAQGH